VELVALTNNYWFAVPPPETVRAVDPADAVPAAVRPVVEFVRLAVPLAPPAVLARPAAALPVPLTEFVAPVATLPTPMALVAPAATLPAPLTVFVALGTPLLTPLTEFVAAPVPVAPRVLTPAVPLPVAVVVAVLAALAVLLVSLLDEFEAVCFGDLVDVDCELVLSSALLAIPEPVKFPCPDRPPSLFIPMAPLSPPPAPPPNSPAWAGILMASTVVTLKAAII
jgi:hypothetical protein